MKNLSEGIVLYHGSYCVVEEPDLEKCARFKDFGRGFYLTSSKEQAKSFAKMAYDDATKLWWDGPASTAECYKEEVEK